MGKIYAYVPGSSPTFDGNDYRPASNVWVYVGTPPVGVTAGWKRAKSVYVRDATANTWRLVHEATPGSVTASYGLPTQTSSTGTQATYSASLSWSAVDPDDSSFSAKAELWDSGTNTMMASYQPANKPQTHSFTINSGQSKTTYWKVNLYNGSITGPVLTTGTQTVSYAGTAAAVTSVFIYADTFTDDVQVNWNATGLPLNGYYEVELQIAGGIPLYATTTATTTTFYSYMHGYNFVESYDFGTTGTATATVRMWNASGTQVLAFNSNTVSIKYANF